MSGLARQRRRRRRRGRSGPGLERSGPWIGVGGLFVLLWLAISTVIYAPWWGVLLHVAVLLPVVRWVARWARTRPAACAFVPFAGIPLLAVVTTLGVTWGHWSA